MKKTILPFIAILMLAFITACSSEDVMPNIDQGAASRTITFTASMPGEDDPATRVSVEEAADRTIGLTWEASDKIDLLFVQGSKKTHVPTQVTNITEAGKKASFTITIPDGISEGEAFDLYGVYGGGEVDATNPELIKLPSIEGTTFNEDNVGKKTMLRFAQTIDATGAVGTVNFEHVGFLFTTKIKVTTGTVNDITSVQLVGATDVNGTWAYNASENHFDMEAGAFTAEGTGSNTVSFQNSEKDTTNNILTVRNWLPATETAWPAIKLSVNGTTETATAKPGRTPVASKAYYLYATWDGADLVFADKEFEVPVVGDGSKENPYSVAEAIAKQGETDVWVKGYIVGSFSNNGSIFGTENASEFNINIADNKDETSDSKVVNVQLTTTNDIRANLNLINNSDVYKKEVLFKGDLVKYNNLPGIKNTKEYVIIPDGPFFESTTTAITLKADAGSTGTIDLSTSEAWTATSSETWLTVSPASGTGISDIIVTAEANTVTSTRTATVTLTPTGSATGLTPIDVTVTQDAFVPSIAVDPASLTFAKEGGSETIAVTSNVAWTATLDAEWATISPANGTNDGTILVSAEANSGADARNATITITPEASSGLPAIEYSVTQAGLTAVFAETLFFSEYIEGSGNNNKGLEIYNGTGAAIDLSDYKVELYTNGSSRVSQSVVLSGTLQHGEVVVIENKKGTLYNGDALTIISPSVCNFNGDDAIALRKISTSEYIDIFGEIGTDPGSAWTATGFSTADMTLVRKPDVKSGVTTNPSKGFPTLATEWIGYPKDTATYLGSHTTNY